MTVFWKCSSTWGILCAVSWNYSHHMLD